MTKLLPTFHDFLIRNLKEPLKTSRFQSEKKIKNTYSGRLTCGSGAEAAAELGGFGSGFFFVFDLRLRRPCDFR